MAIPVQFATWFRSLGFDEVSFGSGGIKILAPEELEEGQVGYSRSREGESLCDDSPGSWKPEWLAIAYETGLGDPIFIDTSLPHLPVMTAMHGEGSWEPHTIAASLQDFALALRAFRDVSKGREHPVALEQNPLSSAERDRALDQVCGAHRDEVETDFWEILLEG